MSWFLAHPWMTFILGYFAIFAARESIVWRARAKALAAKAEILRLSSGRGGEE